MGFFSSLGRSLLPAVVSWSMTKGPCVHCLGKGWVPLSRLQARYMGKGHAKWLSSPGKQFCPLLESDTSDFLLSC